MSTKLDPTMRPDKCVALMLGEAIADDVDTYDVRKNNGAGGFATELPANMTQLFLEIDGRSFECIVFETTREGT